MPASRTIVVIGPGDLQICFGYEKINRAARDFVIGSNDGDSVAGNRALDKLRLFQILHLQAYVGDDGFAHFRFFIANPGDFGDRRNYAVEQRLNVFRFTAALFRRKQSGFNRATAFVPEDDNKMSFQVFDTVFDASEGSGLDYVARYTRNEKCAQALVKDDFGRNAAVRAAQDNGERCLCENLRAAFGG